MEGPDAGKLYEALCELDVHAAEIRRDPAGGSWLPAALRAQVESDEGCREVLREWVEEELEFFDSVKIRGDALFTDRVVKATEPEEIAGAGLDPSRRGVVLAAAYALAAGLGILILREFVSETSLVSTLGQHLRAAIGN